MHNLWLTIKQLDKQLSGWQSVGQKYKRPKQGWVKTIRTALNMSAEQLAKRLSLSRSRITQLEQAEINDAVTLRTLKETANAMECDFIYAIVPKRDTTLENILKKRVEQIANTIIKNVAHSMSLEAQTIDKSLLEEQKKELIKSLLENMRKTIWNEEKKR